jgi:hypothetical protein
VTSAGDGSSEDGPEPPPSTALTAEAPTGLRPAVVELRPTVVGRLVAALPTATIAATLSSIAAPLAAIPLAAYVFAWVAVSRQRIWVDADGVRWRGIAGSGELRWDDVERYVYWGTTPRLVQSGFGPARHIDAATSTVTATRHHLTLHRAGATFVISSTYVGAEHACARALAELHPRLRHRPGLAFTPFTVADDGLRHATLGTLRWAEIEKLTLTADIPPRLRVMKRGKAFAWANESMAKIDNGMLLLEELVGRGITLVPGPRALLSAPVIDAHRRAEALPRAVARIKDST